ncbi:hypothetical protein PAEPH01_2606, partial [Pancytospora epiphaga]
MFLRERVRFPRMYSMCKEVVQSCAVCEQFRKQKKFVINPVGSGKPFEKIGIDLINPLKATSRGNKYIVLATDYATRYAMAKPIKEKSAREVAKFLTYEVFMRIGAPKEIVCDQETEFKNKLLVLLCDYWKTRMRFTTPYHFQAN